MTEAARTTSRRAAGVFTRRGSPFKSSCRWTRSSPASTSTSDQRSPRASPIRSPVYAISSNSGRMEPEWESTRASWAGSRIPRGLGVHGGFSPGSSFAIRLLAIQPRRTANRKTRFSVFRASRAVVGAVERPDLRPPEHFRHPDLLGWVRENRARLLTSLLVLARAWSAGGMQITEGPVLSSFESWSAVVGSVLRFAGLTDFLGNEDRKRDLAEDESNPQREILLSRIYDIVGDRRFTLKELHELTKPNADMAFAVLPFLNAKTSWGDDEAVRQLGYALRTFQGGVYGELRLAKVDSGRDGAIYTVTMVTM
jgi:hypothetical protein